MKVVDQGLAALSAAVLVPAAAGALAMRPAWRVGFPERLGVLPRLPPGTIWVHAASVGEIIAAVRLVDALREGGHGVFTSTVTMTGREVMRRARPEVPCHLAPIDHPWCVATALARVKPSALVLVETELWPCWIAAAERRGVPVMLVSGRVSDRTYPRYRRFERLVGRTLRRLAAVGARTEVDGGRFLTLGADPGRVTITGDLKLDVDENLRPIASDLARVLGEIPLIVAGSTHPGEEDAALAALAEVERAGLCAAIVLAPRHPERASEIERNARGAGRRVRRRTAVGSAPLAAGEVLVLDTFGELPGLYARAAVAFVGGSLVPVGGHNVLEPVVAARPVLYGRYTANHRHAIEVVERSGAGRRVADAAALGRAAVECLREPAAARARGEAGRDFLCSHRGSAERAAKLVEAVLARAAD